MAADTGRPTEVLVPPLGQTVDTVTLVSWYKKEGQAVTQGEMLFAIETDKATLDIEAPASGVLRRVRAAPGDEVKILSVIAVIAAEEEILEKIPATPGAEPARRPARSQPPTGQAGRDGRRPERGERIFISPRARRLAEKHGVPWAMLEPTGPEDAIVERDVRTYLEARRIHPTTPAADRAGPVGAQHAAPPQMETIPVPDARAVLAGRMSQSTRTTAPITLTAEAEATSLVEMRQRLSQDGVDVSYDDLLLHILGKALREHPRLNASLEGDTIKLWQQIHIGLAVDTDQGLLVPVVCDVDRKGLGQLASETHRLIERAKAGQCASHELSGGTFTLSNLGMFGIDSFTPIIHPVECAALGVGRIKIRPAVIADARGPNDRISARQTMWLSLTFDHRLVDGAPAARFLQRVVHLIEQPYLLLS